MKTHKEVMASLSPKRRAAIKERAEIELRKIQAVRELRVQLGLTQEEFAKQIGISQSRVSRLESGSRGLTISDFSGFVKALGGQWQLTVKLPNLGSVCIADSEDLQD